MNWKEYEKEIHDYFRSQFPNADISYNVKINGRYSKVSRQIDILIEDYIAGNRMRIVVDGKYFSEKIDVKDVEMFIGMLNDCEANKGLLITQEGFSEAAINRAYHDPIDIELDIYNFKELLQYQSFIGIPHSGDHGVILQAPFGWIIDATIRDGALATLYQRGLTLIQAQESKEWMYINIKSKDDEASTLEDFLLIQNTAILNDFPDAEISYLPTIKRNDAKTKVRSINVKSYPTIEYTGFVEFDKFIFFCVMFTPEELRKKNLRKLESIMQQALHLDVIVKSFDWDIQQGQRGTIMFLDIPYYRDNQESEEYLTLTVAKDYSKNRPEFISVIVPNNVVPDNGIFLTFGNTIKDNNGHRQIALEDKGPYRIDFENCNDQTCTARIIGGYIKDNDTITQVDIFQKFLDFDHVYFLFVYPDVSHKSVSVPLFSFKQQYSTL